MLKFFFGVVAAIGVATANAMIDGVWIAQLLLFAAGFFTAAVFLMED